MKDTSQQVDDLIANSNHISKWVEEQPSEDQASWAQSIFAKLLEGASQPRGASGNSCVKLCGFVEQSSKSHSQALRLWAYSRDVTIKLFNFYVEWNESDNHRSMKLVLDLLPQLIRRNPDEQAGQATKAAILNNLVSIVTGKSSKPLAKSAIKALDHLVTKDIVTLDEIRSSFAALQQKNASTDPLDLWKAFIFELFHWMTLHFVCPTAGRFIVCLYRGLRGQDQQETQIQLSIETWHKWLLEAVNEEPSIFESVKNYIFLPLFKADKAEALGFLKRMNEHEAVSAGDEIDLNLPALLQLAALEIGKKVGLVEEPALGDDKSADSDSSIVLDEKVLESVLAHPSHEVRSLALSLLMSSPSTTRPYSSTALALLRKHLATYFADSDAKFRNEVAGKVRDMFKRVRGAIFVLKKSIPRAAARKQKEQPGQAQEPQHILYRTNLISLPEAQLTHCLEYHEKFLFWYIDFLCSELTPTASYQRHSASLKAVTFILRMEGEKSKTWETPDDQTLFFDQFGASWLRALSDLIMDPFDDIRSHAATVLKWIFSDSRYKNFHLMAQQGRMDPAEELAELLKRSEDLARKTARADHSDGVARVSQLLYRFSGEEQQRVALLSKLIGGLEERLAVAEKDLGRAVLDAPLHGDFASLCYMWQVVSELQFSESELQSVQALQDTLISCCERVWAAVRDILCDDSPEGHLPQELEEVDGLDTKDVLSYSFRSVHEASNLMRILILSIKQRTRPGRICPSREAYERIGNLSFTQLASLRHRGAFTTVALTFSTCCQLVKHLDQGQDGAASGTTLLEQWYSGTLEAINAQVSTTRRSAGIPAMMTGVLSANAANPSFEQVMTELMKIASQEARVTETDGSNLPQVHAYNCLKEIFKSSYLTSIGNKSEKFLPQCLELAANGLKSELWAIRNCGLILLRSLIDCLFGSHQSKATMEAGWDGKANRIAYHRYSSLPTTLLHLLKSGHQMMASIAASSAAAESVFPALDIIRRAGPPEVLRDELQVHIAKYLASPVWHVREIAARTLCSCQLHAQWLDSITSLAAESVRSQIGNVQNHVHGVLLALKYTIDRLSEVMPEQLQQDTPKLSGFLIEYWLEIQTLESPEIPAAYLEVVNLVRALPRPGAVERLHFEFPAFNKKEGALLRAQRVIHEVHSIAEGSGQIDDLNALLLSKTMGVNTIVAGLDTIPKLWNVSRLSEQEVNQFCNLYRDVCLKIGPAEPRVIALQNLTDILDQVIKSKNFGLVSADLLSEIWNSLPLSLLNPALANSIIRISGCITAILSKKRAVSGEGIKNWGHMVADSGLDDKDFDTRLATVESLCSFFSTVERDQSWAGEEHASAILALYDSLNDDDDDIRDTGSAAVKSILGQALVPIEAANRLLSWLTKHYGNNQTFRQIVVRRIMGDSRYPSPELNVISVKDQLQEAMKFDDSLFVIEEQNLFVDEVRETQRWISVYESLEWESNDPALEVLTTWTSAGLEAMHSLVSQEDGPLGYGSKPEVFAILSRVIRASAALTRHHTDNELLESIDKSTRALHLGNGHISGLLLQPLEKTAQA
ncbi:putative death-receptor fusion protein-domain-containing protein [Fusarium flagelliforme]|uniref:putative death-receptor fusion protein-domain-containing protein n=1 Tax=Fusarium flagelliforme TaxID=2675880 RepID=UPI001E8CC501|nr:putative death-receptor fusion protein-domain-containing protein [Fusarium flagelliforme]KAH7188835.1 putative death-receptor fusion protein-domain-containing protein [Fusarium flagelliforme]